ncbi:MAG: hypothetical protein JSV90_05805 [Methanobacteriota archaeon]|nr:MAG: hypothetical protein JSV90_05805 [Euryarchaeota archaeon]
MEERKIAVIPKVLLAGALGPKEYGILLTSERTIFVLKSSSKAGIGAVVGGAIGAAIADAVSKKKDHDYGNCDPAALAANDKNICVPHSSVTGVELKKRMSGYTIRMDYADDGGKKKLAGQLMLPDELRAKRKAEGVKAKVAMEDYAKMTQQAFELALPPTVAQNAEWKI